jgi:hypothetical protein
VERLEDRNCPTTPSIINFSVVNTTRNWVQVTGQVIDDNPAADHVVISGIVSGSVTPDAQGHFTFTAPAGRLGAVSAVAWNPQMQTSNTAQGQVTSTPPVIINFVAVNEDGNYWTFQGHVQDESAQGEMIYFAGLPDMQNARAMVDANGDFTVTVQLQSGEHGTVTAQTMDWWGLASNQAQAAV